MATPPSTIPRSGYNAAVELLDHNVERGRGAKPAFIDDRGALTYAELQEGSCALGRGLLALGLRQESRVALIQLDTTDLPLAFLGAMRAGIIPIPLNTLLTTEQYAYILRDSRVEAAIVSVSLLEKLRPALLAAPALRFVLVSESAGHSLPELGRLPVRPFEDALSGQERSTWHAETVADEVAFWLYSSGSTGEPKGVHHVHSSLMATATLYGQGVLGVREDDVVFSAAKLFFAYGLGSGLTFPLSVGATTVLLSGRPTPQSVHAIMERYHPTIFCGVPTLYASLLAQPSLGVRAGSDRLRACISAGEALPTAVGERWRQVTGVDILDGIGSTEMLHIFVSNRPGDIRGGASGKPVPGYDVKIVDEQGAEIGDDEIGELIVRGPSAAVLYWNLRAKSRRTFVGEWTHTGDKYLRDREGYYHYCGRTDDMFKVSGLWVSPFEIEAALVSHPAIFEAAVVGQEDADGLMKPRAFVVLRPGFTLDAPLTEQLKTHVKDRAGPWKYPRWLQTLESLPKTATGKIQRFKLRELQPGAVPGTGSTE